MSRDAETYVHGVDASGNPAPVVIVSARVAAYLNKYAHLDDFRISIRGTDKEVDDILVALRYADVWWRNSVTGTKPSSSREPRSQSEWLTTRQAALKANITQRAIRKAIEEKRLEAKRIGNMWQIAQIDLQHFLAQRAHSQR